jgi:hypothetical protein
MTEAHPDLETFRAKWREELAGSSTKYSQEASEPTHTKTLGEPPTHHPAAERKEDDEFDYEPASPKGFTSGTRQDGPSSHVNDDHVGIGPSISTEPKSALEHYEKAVEKESQGSLGDSLNLYRKAYRVRLSSVPGITSSADSCSLTRKWTRRTRTNTFLLCLRNLPTQTRQMLLLPFRIPPITP